ncbi:N-6 DNA methylase [Amphibacillus sp. Q70]|uniref:N-6 DNA methylase n=1 Tax=Amphibacillus sp. Q70 TaxID=3453416 RepID=UPI003F875244
MKFEFETIKKDYGDFSSDRVLINAPRTPAFPVRIASEIMARCLSFTDSSDGISIYDPCCGGGHLLTVIGFLYSANLNKVYGTDIDARALDYAKRNLNLLTMEGLLQRKKSIECNYNKYGKQPQLEALRSVNRLASMLIDSNKSLKDIQCLKWDITSTKPPLSREINIVITDLPYGNMAHWEGIMKNNPTEQMLNNIYQILDLNNSVVAIVSNKKQRIKHECFKQVKRLKHGKRQFTFLRPLKF